MNKASEDGKQPTSGYDESEPEPRDQGKASEGTPHEHQNVPDKKPHPTP